MDGLNLKIASKDIEFDGRTVTVTTKQYVVMRGGMLLGKLQKTGIFEGTDIEGTFEYASQLLAGTKAEENGVVVSKALADDGEINRVFSGPGGYSAIMEAIKHAIEVNYGTFFAENARRLQALEAEVKARLEAQAKTPAGDA